MIKGALLSPKTWLSAIALAFVFAKSEVVHFGRYRYVNFSALTSSMATGYVLQRSCSVLMPMRHVLVYFAPIRPTRLGTPPCSTINFALDTSCDMTRSVRAVSFLTSSSGTLSSNISVEMELEPMC